MADKDNKIREEEKEAELEEQEYSLNDDRRVKVLSPGAMVAKRFFRNRMAMVGLIVLILMFIFSFVGGWISPYTEDQKFYTEVPLQKEYASAIKNTETRFISAEGQEKEFSSLIQAKTQLAINKKADTFEYNGINYKLNKLGESVYTVELEDGTVIGGAYKMIFSPEKADTKIDFTTLITALSAFSNNETSFEANGVKYTVDEEGSVNLADGTPFGYISNYVVQALMPDVFLSREFKEYVVEQLEAGAEKFTYTDEDGECEYLVKFMPSTEKYSITKATASRVFDKYAAPSSEHWLGTDANGMDMVTRLMYGGRVSLVIGFIVEVIATFIAIILGGISGYFGGWVDNLIMRIVDIFYCIPSMPLLIILGAAMDNAGVEPKIRMLYLMLILGVLGWPGMARMIRGQILSLREQEFMTATEASGLSVRRRIFHHLIPNVIPQLIVSVTMGLGGTILTESSLSFLGLGVKFPFASWGNIINDVNNQYVLQNYLNVWIPAGVLLLLTVLAFNIVGDGLRDAFDPKMKR